MKTPIMVAGQAGDLLAMIAAAHDALLEEQEYNIASKQYHPGLVDSIAKAILDALEQWLGKKPIELVEEEPIEH